MCSSDLLIQAHRDLTQWIIEHPEEAQAHVVAELTELTQATFDPELVRKAWARLTLTSEVDRAGLEQFVKDAQNCDLLDRVPSLDGMMYTPDPVQPEAL